MRYNMGLEYTTMLGTHLQCKQKIYHNWRKGEKPYGKKSLSKREKNRKEKRKTRCMDGGLNETPQVLHTSCIYNQSPPP
jgi:hypothetical protein